MLAPSDDYGEEAPLVEEHDDKFHNPEDRANFVKKVYTILSI